MICTVTGFFEVNGKRIHTSDIEKLMQKKEEEIKKLEAKISEMKIIDSCRNMIMEELHIDIDALKVRNAELTEKLSYCDRLD